MFSEINEELKIHSFVNEGKLKLSPETVYA